MIIVTGGAGFIGSCVVARLNELGIRDIVVVDHWDAEGVKRKNLAKRSFLKFYDKEEFLSLILSDRIEGDVSAVIHMGACSSTTGTDRDYYMHNNYEYSKEIALWSLRKKARFIYASSAATYGEGESGYSDDIEAVFKCRPLNLYGESKQLFDEWVINENLYERLVGLKFFNVFGPNEQHKGDMRSVIAKVYNTVATKGEMVLFRSHRPDYTDGEQKRDFVYVKDVVSVICFLIEKKEINGIYNLGTGLARSWNDLAKALFAAVGRKPVIYYVDMPAHLQAKYQYFTQADMAKLRKVGYKEHFMSLEDAVKDYALYLKNDSCW